MAQPDRLATAIESQELILPDTDTLVIRAAPAPSLGLIPRLTCEQSFRPTHDALAEAGHAVTRRATGPAGTVIVTLTRARGENLGNIARALLLLPTGGLLVVNGAKTDGVDSLAKMVAALIPLAGQVTKAHGRVFWLTRPDRLPPEIAPWAESAELRPNPQGFFTAPGLFSPDAPDPGSQRLARILPERVRGRTADLGAGWGWLALQALDSCPRLTQIDLYEAESRALDAARLNITDPRAAFHWTDVTMLGRNVPPYDTVITNPPFHQGRAAEPDLGTAFIAAAARILKPSGQFLMVANRQLPYESALDARFLHWERVAEDGAYKLIAATRPRR